MDMFSEDIQLDKHTLFPFLPVHGPRWSKTPHHSLALRSWVMLTLYFIKQSEGL